MLYFVGFLFKNNLLRSFPLVGLLSTSVDSTCPAYESVQGKSCRTSSVEPARKNEFYQNKGLSDSFFMHLQQESLQKIEVLQKDPAFQEIVTELQNSISKSSSVSSASGNVEEGFLYIFVSFSMGEKALLNIAHDAKRFGATLVLRGFREGSYIKTAQSLQNIIIKTGQGIIIDPELYSLFDITAVPTFVLAKPFNLNTAERTQTPIHDKLHGHVSTHYSLETFSHEGDLKDEAKALLRKGATK